MLLSGSIGLLILGALFWWASSPTWKILYSGLAPDDSRQIASVLTAANLQYDVSADGTTLKVPSGMLDKARLATASKASGKSGRLGFEIFDKPNWAGSDFDEKVNYQRALEGELEHTIDTLADVQSARVHLVMPHDALFQDQQRDAKASVVLKLKSGTLSDTEAESIRGLVASAVDDLKPDRVVLVDADGHFPMGGRKTAADANAAYEQALSDHIVQTLEPVAGEGNVRAIVAVDYDTSSTDEMDERYDPASVVNLSMERSEETSGGQTPATGVPGTATNAPNQQPPLFPTKQSGVQSTKQESGTYAASKKTTHLIQGPGRLRRITAAILVNDRMIAPLSKKGVASHEPWTAAQLQQLVLLSQAAVGYDVARGDQVVVQNLRFQEPSAEGASALQRALRNAAAAEPLMKYATIVAIAAVLLFFVVRPVLGRHLVAAAQLPQAALPGQGREAAVSGAHSARTSQVLFEQVVDHIQRDPAQSARILQTWMKAD
jgi:flagellar M-ring protein FliF